MNEVFMVVATNSADAQYGVDTWSYVVGIFDTKEQAEIAREAEITTELVNGMNVEVTRISPCASCPDGYIFTHDPNDRTSTTYDIISIPMNKHLEEPICVGGATYYE